MSNQASLQVTVVTITWNNRAGLEATMESLAKQVGAPFQHVVVDGASSDGSAEYARRHPASRHATVVSEKDRGIYDAMNKGLALASAPLVTFLNAGDVYAHPDVLRHAVASFRQGGWVWGFGLGRLVAADGVGVRPVRFRPYSNLAHGLGTMVVYHQCVFMQTDWLRALGGFDDRHGLAADTYVLLKTGVTEEPGTWPTVDVSFLAGGRSQQDWVRQLWRRHRIRVEVWGLGLVGRSLSAGWVLLRIPYLFFKSKGKAVLMVVLGRRFRLWWAGIRRGGAQG